MAKGRITQVDRSAVGHPCHKKEIFSFTVLNNGNYCNVLHSSLSGAGFAKGMTLWWVGHVVQREISREVQSVA